MDLNVYIHLLFIYLFIAGYIKNFVQRSAEDIQWVTTVMVKGY